MRRKPVTRFGTLSRYVLILGCLAASLSTTSASFADGGGGNHTVTVRMENLLFVPREIVIVPGTTVTWVNHDETPHIVVGVNKSFRSKVMVKETRFSLVFMDVGTFDYICSVHPTMKGKVVVKAS